MARYLSVKTWERFQHYKDRDPPWIKLYRDTLTSECWVLGTDLSRLMQIASTLLAARYSNRIPLKYELWRKVANLDCREGDFNAAIAHLVEHEFLAIQELNDSCQQDASSALAICSSEGEAEQSRGRAEKKRASAPDDSPDAKARGEADPPPGLDPAAWSRWCDYRVKIRKPLKPVSIPAAQRELAAFGCDQAAVVEQSVAQGWQGLFALKAAPKLALKSAITWRPPADEVADAQQ